jgi:hypothetical protein
LFPLEGRKPKEYRIAASGPSHRWLSPKEHFPQVLPLIEIPLTVEKKENQKQEKAAVFKRRPS